MKKHKLLKGHFNRFETRGSKKEDLQWVKNVIKNRDQLQMKEIRGENLTCKER